MVAFPALLKPYVETRPIGSVWVALWVVTAVIRLAGAARRRGEATKKDRGSRFVLRITVIPAVTVLIASPTIAPTTQIRPPLLPVVVGIFVFATGQVVRIWAKVALGRYFTSTVMTSSDEAVVTRKRPLTGTYGTRRTQGSS